MVNKRKWTLEQLKQAIKESISWNQSIKKIGLKSSSGGNCRSIKNIAIEQKFDFSHFLDK